MSESTCAPDEAPVDPDEFPSFDEVDSTSVDSAAGAPAEAPAGGGA